MILNISVNYNYKDPKTIYVKDLRNRINIKTSSEFVFLHYISKIPKIIIKYNS